VVIAVAVLVLVQAALLAVSVVVLARTARERLVFGRKWPWAVVIALVNIIGPIVFLAAGRRAAPVDVGQSAEPKGGSLARAVENLYGENRG
jgi:hypothetical protein